MMPPTNLSEMTRAINKANEMMKDWSKADLLNYAFDRLVDEILEQDRAVSYREHLDGTP